MKSCRSIVLRGYLGFACLAACSNTGTPPDSSGGEGGSDDGAGGDGGQTDGIAGAPGSGGVSVTGGKAGLPQGGAGGQGQGGVAGVSPVTTEIDTSSWGPCQTIAVPPGLTAGAPKTQPAVADKCLPKGSGMSRSLSLMATSTVNKRHKVKVLFYGQSITRGGWVPTTEAHLRKTFPNADLEIRMEAVGGFTASQLMGPMEHDVIPWHPDLIIYHTLGPTENTDIFLQVIRRKTTAEVMQQTQHVSGEGAATQVAYDKESYIHYPNIAKRLGIHIIDIRTPWKEHLQQIGKGPEALLSDTIHLNAAGNVLYADITNSQLKYESNVLVDPLRMVTVYEVGKHVQWSGNKLVLPFEGNRIEVEAKLGGNLAVGAATVLIDGKKPSDFFGAYGITRPNRAIDNNWPWGKGSVTHVSMDPAVQPRVEKWTMTLTSIDKAGNCAFTVEGSVTGPDGSGTCAMDFTSTSKRVVIKKQDHFFASPQDPDGPTKITIPVGYKITWDVIALHADRYPSSVVDASDPSREDFTTLVHGIPNGKHTLELTSTGATPPSIQSIRVHRPPLR